MFRVHLYALAIGANAKSTHTPRRFSSKMIMPVPILWNLMSLWSVLFYIFICYLLWYI